MDDALKRTRRNMIGVSVALFLVYLLKAGFPHDLKVFNYDIPLAAPTIEILAWAFLTYLGIEYFVHLRSKFAEITKIRRQYLTSAMSMYVWNNIDSDVRNDRINVMAKSNPTYALDSVSMVIIQLRDNELLLDVTPHFIDSQNKIRSGTNGPAVRAEFQYSKIKRFRLLAWFKVIFTEGIGFEYLLPVAYPLAALCILAVRRWQDFGQLPVC